MRRIASMDVVRGLAILLMFVDHILFLLGYSSFSMFEPRFFTRMAEPLFAVLFGYFLVGRTENSLMGRFFEIMVVAILINILVYPFMGSLEILASFTLSFLAYALLRERIVFLMPLVLLFNLDPTTGILSYPIFLVLPQVALGVAMRKGITPSISIIFALMSFFVVARFEFSFLFTALACAILLVAEKHRGFSVPIIEHIGKRPLFFYVIQYIAAIILMIFARQYLAI
jgi:uncharacterized membrane protein